MRRTRCEQRPAQGAALYEWVQCSVQCAVCGRFAGVRQSACGARASVEEKARLGCSAEDEAAERAFQGRARLA